MILHFTILLAFQLIGEAISRLVLPFAPGPVIGMALFVCALALMPQLAEDMRKTVTAFLSHLALFFVPAGVGVITQLSVIGSDALAIGVALVLSTLAAIVVGALVFAGVSKLVGGAND